MKKQKENHIISDINTFDAEASIYKILFQDRATALLKYIIDKISIDRYENENFKLPAIMIAGREGKHLITRAFSNSMCNSFEFIQGKHLGLGGSFGSLLENSEKETIYYINQADKLSPYSISNFHKFLTIGYVKYHDRIKGENVIVPANNKLFIFGTDDPKKLCPDLFKAIDYHCYLKNYDTREAEILVEQRLKWCGIDCVKEVPAIIVRNGKGSMSNCMRLLSLCHLVMRASSRSRMTAKDVEIGIGLNHPQGGIAPPPLSDDIPF